MPRPWAAAGGRKVIEDQNEKVVPRGVSVESARAVLAQKGKLSSAELVRLRVRYFTDGVALGSKDFLEGIFEAHRRAIRSAARTGSKTHLGIRLPLLHAAPDAYSPAGVNEPAAPP